MFLPKTLDQYRRACAEESEAALKGIREIRDRCEGLIREFTRSLSDLDRAIQALEDNKSGMTFEEADFQDWHKTMVELGCE